MKIDHRLCHELMRFLEREDQFLTQVLNCAAGISEQPVGTPFTRLVDAEISEIERAAGKQKIDRAKFRTMMSELGRKNSISPRVSELDAGPELTAQLQRQRMQVLQKALTVHARLDILLAQLRESNVIVTAILETVLGINAERSRYDSAGKPVGQFSHIERQRVA